MRWPTPRGLPTCTAAAGITPRGLVDCMIVSVALRKDVALLTADRDVELMATVVPLRLDPT